MMTATEIVTGSEARKLILAGDAPEGMRVRGCLDLSDTNVTSLPPGLQCYQLVLRNTPVQVLPADLRVEYKLDLTGCAKLIELPPGLKVGSLVLRGCTALEALPEALDVCFLDLRGCARFHRWPRQAAIRIGRLNVAGCVRLTSLPDGLRSLSQLDVSNCVNLRELPDGLRVSSWIDLANTQISALPRSLEGVRLRWRGVPIDERIAFRPESITVEEVLAERNAELRRVLLERFGYERFMLQAKAEVLDRDRDAGGERQLLRVPLEGDEDLVCVAVFCPSTGRRYLLRVPPAMKTCRQAVAWTAGFTNPRDYRPLVET